MFNTVPQQVAEFLSSYKYKIELHAHTCPGSDCSSIKPKEMIHLLKEQNYDAVVIT